MRIIAWMLTKMLVMRFLVILLGITAFVIMLDLIAYADDVLKLHDNEFRSLAYYALLRSPSVMAQFVVISTLLAALLMLTDVSRHSELVAIWSSGISHFKIIAALLPVAAVIGIANFLIVDLAIPRAAPILVEWGIGEHSQKQLNIGKDDPIWMRAGRDVLRAVKSNDEATFLEDVIIFRRDSDGLLSEQIVARQARLVNNRWALDDVAIYYRENEAPVRIDSLIYSGPLRPAATGTRSGDPSEMSLATLSYFIANAGFGVRPAHLYRTWWHKRITALIAAALMILIAVPLSGRFRRGGGLGIMFATGVAMGFAFFIFDGVSLTMGELGILPPWFAAWTPVAVFASAAGAIVFKQENL
jgi:lipopolysaccharide export system permease protein